MVVSLRVFGAAALLWLAGAGLAGFAAGTAALEPGGVAGAVLAGGAAAVAAVGLAGAGRGRSGGLESPRLGLIGAAVAVFAVGVLSALGPRSAAPDDGRESSWELPEDAELAVELLRVRAELDALGARPEERTRILDGLLARELARREAAEAAQREAEEAAARAEREAERERERVAERIRSDRLLVQAGRIAAMEAGPLADRERWQHALAQLEVLDVRYGRAETLETELELILRELLDSLEARREGAGGPLGTAIAAIDRRLRVSDRTR